MEKKSQSNMGRGIKLISDIKQYRSDILEQKNYDAFGKNDTAVPSDSTEILLAKLDKMDGVEEKKFENRAGYHQRSLNFLVKKLQGLTV